MLVPTRGIIRPLSGISISMASLVSARSALGATPIPPADCNEDSDGNGSYEGEGDLQSMAEVSHCRTPAGDRPESRPLVEGEKMGEVRPADMGSRARNPAHATGVRSDDDPLQLVKTS